MLGGLMGSMPGGMLPPPPPSLMQGIMSNLQGIIKAAGKAKEQARQAKSGSTMAADETMETLDLNDSYAGLLIGRGGENVKMIQEQSQTMINVPKEADINDGMRKVTIKGTRSAIQMAKDLIWKMIEATGENLGRTGLAGPKEHKVELPVSEDMVGAIIGKGGETIRRIQQSSKARIQIAKDQEGPIRVVVVRGTEEAVQAAKVEIEILQEEKEGRFGGPGGAGPRGGPMDRPRGPEIKEIFPITESQVGLIIGRGGEMIRELEMSTGTKLSIPREPPAGALDKSERAVLISGSQEAVQKLKKRLEELLGLGPSIGVASLNLLVRDDQIGIVVGRSGDTVRKIESLTGTKIRVPKQSEDRFREVEIRGNQRDIERAAAELEEVLHDREEVEEYVTLPIGEGEGLTSELRRMGERGHAVRIYAPDGGSSVRIRGLPHGVAECTRALNNWVIRRRIRKKAETVFAFCATGFESGGRSRSRSPRR